MKNTERNRIKNDKIDLELKLRILYLFVGILKLN